MRTIVRVFVQESIAEGLGVATNIDIDKVLIEDAMKAGGHTTKRAVVIEALQEYIQKRNQLNIIEMFDTVPYDKDYDYKKQRNRG